MTGSTVCVRVFKGAVAGGAVAASGKVLLVGAVGLDQVAFRVMTIVTTAVYQWIEFIDQRRRIAVAAGAVGRIDLNLGVMVRSILRMNNIPVQRMTSDAVTTASRKAGLQI